MSVQLVDVKKRYQDGRRTHEAVAGVSLTLEPGTLTVLAGPSGSGKSTLLALCGGMTTPTSGDVRLFGQSIVSLRDHHRAQLRRERVRLLEGRRRVGLRSRFDEWQNVDGRRRQLFLACWFANPWQLSKDRPLHASSAFARRRGERIEASVGSFVAHVAVRRGVAVHGRGRRLLAIRAQSETASPWRYRKGLRRS